jgi:hypothetical protein
MQAIAKAAHWCEANWWLVSLIAYGLINVCNAISKHWSEQRGLVKALTFGTEALSVLTSKEAPTWLKLPGQVGKKAGPSVLLPLIVAGSLSMSGCCTTARCYLAKGPAIISSADKIALPAIESACKPGVERCKGKKPEECPALQRCEEGLLAYRVAMDSLGRALAAANKALEVLGVK